MKKIICLLLLLFIFIFTASCAPGAKMSGGYDLSGISIADLDGYAELKGREFYFSVTGDGKIGAFDSKTGEEIELSPELEEQLKQEIPSGQLTASAYNDNDYYDFYLDLITRGQDEKSDGVFYEYYKDFAFKLENRIKLTFPKDYSVKVELKENSATTYKATSLTNGNVYLFAEKASDSYNVTITYNTGSYINSFDDVVTGDKVYTTDDLDALVTKNNTSDTLDLLFMIDTTGSMGDELKYIQSEVDDVISKVKQSNPNVNVRLGLLFYRDNGDRYVTRKFNFTTDINKQKDNLADQSAAGGGDFEENVVEALTVAYAMDWSTDSTKLLIHIADAPSHDSDIAKWNTLCKTYAEKGIRIITVASSGIDKKTEYFFRAECMMTGGIYTYLTNDSGIGGDHLEATTKETPEVEFLNSMLVRIINGYVTGTLENPVNWRSDSQYKAPEQNQD